MYERLLGLVERLAEERGVAIFNQRVRLMVDFELSFHNAARLYESGRDLLLFFPLCEQHQEEGKVRRRCAEKVKREKLDRGQTCGNDKTCAYDAPIASHRIHHSGSG